ncbi:hypothetical protein ACEF17_13290, partial [Streptococcus hyovaginalis]
VLSPFILGLYTVAVSIRNMLISLIHGAISVYLMPKLMDLKGTGRYMTVEIIHGTLFYGTFFV